MLHLQVNCHGQYYACKGNPEGQISSMVLHGGILNSGNT